MQLRAQIYNLQYLRAIAAVWVVWGHSTFQVDKLDPFLKEVGVFGVDIFFVLSGFIMVYIAKPTDQPFRFLKRRINRIVPLYWFFTFFMAATLLFAPQVFKSASFEFEAFLKSLFFIPGKSIVNAEEIWPIVSPGWTLNYEMYFYLIFGLILFAKPRLRVIYVIAVIGLVCLLTNVLRERGVDTVFTAFYSNTIVFEFVFGMLLASFFLTGKLIKLPAAAALIVIGFALLVIVSFLGGPELHVTVPSGFSVSRLFGFGIPALMIVAGFLYINLPEIKWIVFLGNASYSIYIAHLFFLGACRVMLPGAMPANLFGAIFFSLLATIVCTLGGCAVHVLIDNFLLKPTKIKYFISMCQSKVF